MQKIPFLLMEHAVGEITYEYTLAQRLYGDIYVSDSERNFFLDRYHEKISVYITISIWENKK